MTFVHNVNVRNVNGALPNGLRILSGGTSFTEPSRNGPVRVAPGPVMTIYQRPTERVLFSPMRDANPFFHLFESLWMLDGRNDLAILTQFNKRFSAYSDDGGQTQPAAYGYRWRKYFGYDQLEEICTELGARPDSRRAVLAMWDGGRPDGPQSSDMVRALKGSADIPCNTQCYFRVIGNKLHMTITCRSNDILWGAYGANAVHFSVMMEYVATALGLEVGVMYQLSNNYHFYQDVVGDAMALALDAEQFDLYATERLTPVPMFAEGVKIFTAELPKFMDWIDPDMAPFPNPPELNSPFLATVAVPMFQAWRAHKAKDYGAAEAACGAIMADDWRIASRQWMERRARNHRAKADG